MTTETKTRSRKPPAAELENEHGVEKGMRLTLLTSRAVQVAEEDGRATIRSWDEGDELVVGVDVDVDEAIRMLNAQLAEAVSNPPARSAGERR